MSECGPLLELKKSSEGISITAKGGEDVVVETTSKELDDVVNALMTPKVEHHLTKIDKHPIIDNISKLQSLIGIAVYQRISIKALQKNWDLLANIWVRVDGHKIEIPHRVGRIDPNDILNFLTRRLWSKERRQLALNRALDKARDRAYAIDPGRARTALQQDVVTTDPAGIALDFNPGENVLDKIAYEELLKTQTDDLITQTALNDAKKEIRESMTSHLFGASSRTGAAEIVMTGSRHHDFVQALKVLVEKNHGEFLGLTAHSSNAEIGKVIKKLRKHDPPYVFHHSGKVRFNKDGYPVTELQLIRRDSHKKMLESSLGKELGEEYEIWLDALGEAEELAKNELEVDFLRHIGSCKIFSMFYGIGAYK